MTNNLGDELLKPGAFENALQSLKADFDSNNYGLTLEIKPDTDPVFREQAIDVEKKAYAGADYGDRAEGLEMFENQYRRAKVHGDIKYMCVYSGDRLLAFFSVFQMEGFLFPESKAAKDASGIADLPVPTIIFSKLVRDPDARGLLKEAGMPHRRLLINVVKSLCRNFDHGILMETHAQPDSQNMLRDFVVRAAFPFYRRILDVETNEEVKNGDKRKPRKLLLYFPHPLF